MSFLLDVGVTWIEWRLSLLDVVSSQSFSSASTSVERTSTHSLFAGSGQGWQRCGAKQQFFGSTPLGVMEGRRTRR